MIQHHVMESAAPKPTTAVVDRALDRFGLFLLVAVCLAADQLPKKDSRRPGDRAIGYTAAAVIAAVGVVGRVIDFLSGIDRAGVVLQEAQQA